MRVFHVASRAGLPRLRHAPQPRGRCALPHAQAAEPRRSHQGVSLPSGLAVFVADKVFNRGATSRNTGHAGCGNRGKASRSNLKMPSSSIREKPLRVVHYGGCVCVGRSPARQRQRQDGDTKAMKVRKRRAESLKGEEPWKTGRVFHEHCVCKHICIYIQGVAVHWVQHPARRFPRPPGCTQQLATAVAGH